MEDVLQQAWLKIQGAITRGSRVPSETDETRAWCYSAIASAMIEFERRHQRPALALALVPDCCASGQQSDEVQRLHECIERLPPDERTVIRMRLQRYTLQEIADELGLRHPSAVQRMEVTARDRLRTCISD
jgi:RNA polymerase sigma factor (sigma-70 family)